MSIKKGLKKSRKVLLAICVPFLALAICATALVGALLGAGDNKRTPASNLADSTTAVNTSSTITIGANGKIDFNSNAGVKQLIEYIGGTGKNYNDVANSLTTPKLASAFTTQTVTFGGIVWNVMYVSKADYTANGTDKGDVIVTLWQADVTSPDLNGGNSTKVYTSAYSGSTASDTPNDAFPSAMYGSSLVRSTLVGSKYSTTRTSLDKTTGVQDAHWKLFTTEGSATTNGYAKELATPANMAWQEVQYSSNGTNGNYSWYFPNDAWAPTKLPATVQSTSGWYYKSGNYYNYSDNSTATTPVYSEWKNDKLWLPSMVETGWGDTTYKNKQGTAGSGLWDASAAQCAATGSSTVSYAWLRSGNVNYANYAYVLNSSGSHNGYATTTSGAVRPALHLNLKSAAKAAGLFEQPIEYHTNYGTAPVDPDGKYIPGTDTELMSVTGEIPPTLEFNGWAKGGYDGEIITSLEGQGEPLDLYATFKPKAATLAASTPADKIINTYYGATNVTMSAALSHALVGGANAQLTFSTYWRYNDGATNIAASAATDGITLTDGAEPSLVLTRPAQARTGKYTLYYTLTPTTAAAATGIRPLANQKACDFQLTVYGAQATVTELPTLEPSQIYVGQTILSTQLEGGHVSCATMSDPDVAGLWQITSVGVFTSSGKIYAKFTPADPEIAPIENVEIPTNAIQLSLAVSEDVSNVSGQAAAASANIKFDYYTDIGFTLSGNKITFSVTRDGTAATQIYTISAPAGYDAYLTCEGEEITSSPIKYTVANKSITVKYRAKQVGYTVYYLLQSADGTDNGGYPTATTQAALEAELGSGYVYKYTGTGYTGDTITYLDEQNLPLNATLAGGAGNMSQRTVDTVKTGNIGKIKGDGSSIALVYLKLNEYTVTYSAEGASPSSQTKSVRYGAKLTAPARKPTKSMSDFKGWMDEDGTLVINDKNVLINDNITVTADMTLTAKFDVKQFHITFNLNISDYDPYALPAHSELTLTTNSAKLGGGRVNWDVQSLFPDDEGFGFTETSNGICTITYNIDNVSQTMSIKGIKPSAIGYTFDGWYLNVTESSTLTTTIKKPNINTYDMELTARWSPAKFTMHYDKQDGSYNAVTTGTVYQQSLFSSIDKLKPANNPKRSGYVFEGWYITPSTDTSKGHTLIEDNLYIDETGAYFTIANIAKPYGNAAGGYDFSDLTLYAEWSSIDAYIEDISDPDIGNLSFEDNDGTSITETDPVHIGDTITVTVSPKNGYEFVRLIVNGQRLDAGVLQFTIKGSDVDKSDTIIVDAEYQEKRYEIKYNNNGGTSAGGNFSKWYTRSMLTDGEVVLSSNLTKLGYDFRGWKFDNGRFAHEEVGAGDLRGEDLRLLPPTDDDGRTSYRNVNLTAVWEEQTATVNLFNANYTNDEYSGTADDGYVITAYENVDLKTDMDIEIDNPTRGAFDFLGWATSRNGAVVYPVDETKDTISYKVHADHDSNGNSLNLNNLYAVWHVKGVNRIIMTVDNNGCTYGGAGVTMTAKPAQSYAETSGETISLTYKWYRIYDGMYDVCFTVGKVFINNEKTTGYEFNGIYYDKDGKTIVTSKPEGEEFEYRRFEESSAGTGCVLARTPSANPSLNIKNVSDCGRYVCVVEVEATSSTGSTTRAGGYGEIEIFMEKADYTNLVLSDVVATYNAKARASAVRLTLGKTDGATLSTVDGVNYLSLPDFRLDADNNRITNSNSKLIVTYKYYVENEDGSRDEIVDLNQVKGVGTYYIVVSFAFTPDGDKGNYNLLETEEAVLEITPFVISENIGFTFVHGEDRTTTTVNGIFSGDYDGVAYSVEAAIKDRFGVSSDYVAQDDVTLVLTVNDVVEGGDIEHVGETVGAGRYSVVVSGLGGSSAGNYVFKNGLNLRQEYVIGKSVYAVSGHIEFADKTVEFDNELHTLEINVEDKFELPSTVTVKYDAVFEAEDGGFTLADHLEDNFNALGNAGRYAGVYTITVTFEDSAASNYAEIPAMTAKLTVTKANLFKYFNKVHGEDLLADAGFVSSSFAFNANKDYLPKVAVGSKLANTDNFAITYEYYLVKEVAETKSLLSENEKIKEPGKYEIVANIEFVSALYSNNFDDVLASESTITYVIRNVDVESINVTFADAFVAGGKAVKLGEGFNYSWIKQIDVVYLDKETGERSTRNLTGDSIALAQIILENNQTTFWHVGSFDVKVSVYGTESTAYEFTVKEDVKNFVLKYSVGDDGEYRPVGDNGLEMLTDGMYGFIVEYECTNEAGEKTALSSVASVSEDGLVLGTNLLTVAEDYYAFSEVSVKIYKVITDDVVWQYSTDGENWSNIEDDYPDYTLPYIGAEYFIRVAFTDGGEEQSCPAKTVRGRPVLNYTADHYLMRVDESGNYRIDAECNITIAPCVLEVTWSDGGDGFVYNGLHQAPVVDTDNIFAVDKDKVAFKYQLEDEDGNVLREYDVICAGTYVIKVELISDDPAYANNYTVYGSETATHTFVIDRATVDMSVTYSESNYGENVTYAGNAHGLRLDALKANFDKSSVSGSFAFIKYTEDGKFVEIAGDDEAIKSKLTGTPDSAEIDYAFIPDDDNYKVTTGQLSLTVLEQSYKTGKDSLLIVRSEEAKPYHLVGNQFDTKGIIVYRLYQSYYTEGDRWYGFRGEPVNANLVIGDSPANGYLIDKEIVSGGMITLKAISGTNTGYLDVAVIEKEAENLEITSTDYRTEFYVGETYDFSDMEFRAIFDSETAQDGLKKGTVTCDFDGEEFDTAGEKVITFSCFGATCELTVLVKEKEDLQIVNFKNAEETLVWTGEELAVPALKFKIDGDEYTTYDGITVTCKVMQGQQEVTLKNEGTYTVTYTVTVTNPRFNKVTKPIGITVYVTQNPYSATVTLPTELSKVYTGNSMSIPRPVIGDVLDASKGNAVVHDYTVVYTINGEEVSLSSDKWSVKQRGEYVVTITIMVGEYNAILSGNDSYTFEVTQAANTAEISVPSFVVLGKTQFDFKVTAKFGEEFGANIAVEYKHESGNWSTELPSIAGKWFARVKIAEEEEYGNFAAVTTDSVEFEVRNPEASANVGNGSISGGNGIGDKWELEITRMEAETVSQVSISKQDVHDGYEVVLKKPGGTVVSGEGEYTVRVKLAEELSGRSDLKVFFKDANGNTVEKSAKVVDGYIEFKTSEFGTFIITSAQPKASVGLLIAVIVLGVVAAGMITACIIVFVKKKKKGAQQ